MRAIRRFTVRPVLPEVLRPLLELATNLRWSWHPETQDLFAAMDPEQWEASGRDPVKLLGLVSSERLVELAADKKFLRMLELAKADLEQYLTGDRWFQRAAAAGETLPRSVAYFSPEYGITSVLPQYSGGLGILAGDHLKTASDLGVPLVGVGLLYRHGYFRQALSREGWQQETYPVLDPDGLPITPLREPDGSHAQVSLDIPGDHPLLAQIWVAQVGRVPLLLLDSDVEANPEPLRDVTDRLYGGTVEHRLLQELLLGVGGIRALRSFARITGAPDPEVFHTNEGHAGFLGLERIRELAVAEGGPGLDFATALEVTRAGTLFTTHTPVPAGIDRFPRDLIAQYFGAQSPVAGVRVEDPATFEAMHGLVSRLVAAGQLQGLRIDHIDGLHNPHQYLRRLQTLIRRVNPHGRSDFYLLIEKILAEGESLPRFAGVAGTTGYEWLNVISHLLLDWRGLDMLDLAWRGIQVTVLEQRPAGQAPSVKCNHIASRTMEAFRRLGFVERIHVGGRDLGHRPRVHEALRVGRHASRLRSAGLQGVHQGAAGKGCQQVRARQIRINGRDDGLTRTDAGFSRRD